MNVEYRQLQPYQRKVLDAVIKDGNYFVKGEAGTGKSIVMAHAVSQYLALHKDAKVIALTYTNALVSALKADLSRRKIDVMTFHKFVKLPKSLHWDCIFVDEVQDLAVSWAESIRARGDKFLLFGDFGQTLYDNAGNELVTEECLCDLFSVELKLELNVDCRLPLNGQKFVKAIFKDRNLKAGVLRTMANTEITLFNGRDLADETAYAIERAKMDARPNEPSAVIFESKRYILHFLHSVDPQLDGHKINLRSEEVNDILRKHNIPYRFLGNGVGDMEESKSRALTYVMTWHSAKGLSFKTVVLPRLGESACRPNPFYVALTRFTRCLVITYSSMNDQIEKALDCQFVRLLRRDPVSQRAVAVEKGALQQKLF